VVDLFYDLRDLIAIKIMPVTALQNQKNSLRENRENSSGNYSVPPNYLMPPCSMTPEPIKKPGRWKVTPGRIFFIKIIPFSLQEANIDAARAKRIP